MTSDDGPGWRQQQEQEEQEQQDAVEALGWFETFGAQHDSRNCRTQKDGASTPARALRETSDKPFAEAAETGRTQGKVH